MLLQPTKKKFKKSFKKKIYKLKNEKIIFGEFALKSLENTTISAQQFESARNSINKNLKKLGFLWSRIFPQKPITKKPSEIRMGKGKGALDHWAIDIYKGTIMFEISGISPSLAIYALKSGSKKLAFKTKILSKTGL